MVIRTNAREANMKRIVTILTEGYADWEIALVTAVARGFYSVEILHAAPRGQAVVSAGGLQVTPNLAIEAIDLKAVDALIVCGGSAWQSGEAPDLSDLLQRANAAGVLIGGICDGTRVLAKAGLLDQTGHTSNSPENLIETGYAGAPFYWDVPHAVAVDGIITAPGTAPVSFMTEILTGLGLGDGNLDYYAGLHAAEHRFSRPGSGRQPSMPAAG
jgi:putative intracellular protease/amidase